MMDLILHDATLWVAFSFALFVVLAFVLGRKMIIASLDEKIAKIRDEIETSDRLRTEALELLAQYQDKQKNAQIEADRILTDATAQAKSIQAKLDAEFEDSMARREQMLKERIVRMQDQARDDIRKYAAELAMSATAEIITQKMDQTRSSNLVDQSIRKVSDQLN
jgi:F-type H+-transporting ATPase subunit b